VESRALSSCSIYSREYADVANEASACFMGCIKYVFEDEIEICAEALMMSALNKYKTGIENID
jgi:hypothetical protein